MNNLVGENHQVRPAPLWAIVLSTAIRRLPAGKIMFSRWLRDREVPAFIARMPRRLGGAEFLCSPHDNIAYDVFFAGCWEPLQEQFVCSVLRPGMSFVDVGANWGLYTLLAASLVGSDGQVLACEPDPRAYDKLRSNLARNRLTQVQAIPLAVTDSDSHIPLAMHSIEARHYGTSRLVANPEGQQVRSIRSISLDALLDQTGFDRVDLLKIDVEGAEDLVLKGMESGLRRGRYRRILLEIHPWLLEERGRIVGDVVDGLRRCGYAGFTFDWSVAGRRRAIYARAPDFREFIHPFEGVKSQAEQQTLWLAEDMASLTRTSPDRARI